MHRYCDCRQSHTGRPVVDDHGLAATSRIRSRDGSGSERSDLGLRFCSDRIRVPEFEKTGRDKGDQQGGRMDKQFAAVLWSCDHKRMTFDQTFDKRTKLTSTYAIIESLAGDNIEIVNAREMDNYVFGFCVAEYKPGIAFVRKPAIGYNRQSSTDHRRFNAIKFCEFLIVPVSRSGCRP